MRAHLLAFGASMLLAACASSTTGDGAPTPASEPTLPSPAADGGSPAPVPAASPGDPPPPPPDCSLAALPPAADVSPVFVVGAPAPTMTGGTLSGTYVVDKAKVILPSAAAGIVDTAASKGKIAAWAVFAGPRYRLSLSSDFTIATSFGPQAQSMSTDSQGAFTATGPVLKLDHACDGALADEADYSFTDDGSGRATILIRTPTPYGDTYLELGASTK